MAEKEVNEASGPQSTAVGHLSVHFADQHPVEVPFLFEQQERRIPRAFGLSAFSHAAIFVLIIVLIREMPATQVYQTMPAKLSDKIVWIAEAGPGGGGGGGGNKMPLPARKAELPGKDKITVPVTKPKPMPLPTEKPKEQEKLPQVAELNIPAKVLGDSAQTVPGVLDGGVKDTLSQGPGTGGGSGTGTGTGIGPGNGSGLGPGTGGGTGGGYYQPGSGIDDPRILREVKPQYTADAMRAKVQGSVLIECVVMPDGTVSDVHVVRSLDPVFGLDQEAVKAARQWRFIPGVRRVDHQPVPVQVTIELTFTLR